MPDLVACQFRGEMWSVSEQARQRYGTFWIRHGSSEGFNPEPDTINGGGNSGFQAVHLAATFGSTRIGLLGFDMQRTGGKEHWHGKHKGKLPNGKGFPNWISRFKFLARDLEYLGVEAVNCTRETQLQGFKRRPLEEVVDDWSSEPDAAQRVQAEVELGSNEGIQRRQEVGVQGPAPP